MRILRHVPFGAVVPIVAQDIGGRLHEDLALIDSRGEVTCHKLGHGFMTMTDINNLVAGNVARVLLRTGTYDLLTA
jgi:hypothetical protein